jgi:tRNA A-37 threonylcarbamoyl transferase component Bud32
MEKLWKKGISVPKLFKVNHESFELSMEHIDGTKLKDHINDPSIDEAALKELLIKMG